MTFLKVFLVLTLLGFLLTMASVRLRISYYKELGLKISYLCFTFTIFPQKKKPPKKKEQAKKAKKQEEEKPKKENIFQTVYREKGLEGLLHLLRSLVEIAGGTLKRLFTHLRAKKLSLHVSVANEDAAETALMYGKVCAVVYPSFSVLTGTMKCKKFEVAVVPDFQSGKTQIQGEADVTIRVAVLLITAAQALIRYMKTVKSAKLDDEQTKRKGGAVNEQQSSD